MINIAMPLRGLMDYNKCYEYLLNLLHAQGLHCPCGHLLPSEQKPHKYRKNGLPCYKCTDIGCKKVFNIFTNTIFQGIHYNCVTIVLMLKGFAQGVSTQLLSKELSVSYNQLLDWRHILQEHAFENRDISRLQDKKLESDEFFQNAGEKGEKHPSEDDPPRVRANKKKRTRHL